MSRPLVKGGFGFTKEHLYGNQQGQEACARHNSS